MSSHLNKSGDDSVVSLRAVLERVMDSDDVSAWLQTPNDAFGGLKPLEVIERGESDRVWRMLYLIESGAAF